MSKLNFDQLAGERAAAINQKIARHDDSSNQQVQAIGSELRQELLDCGLAYSETVHHRYCGVDVDNRHGEMLFPIRVYELLQIITKKGWSWGETAMALAREVSNHGTDAYNHQVEVGGSRPRRMLTALGGLCSVNVHPLLFLARFSGACISHPYSCG